MPKGERMGQEAKEIDLVDPNDITGVIFSIIIIILIIIMFYLIGWMFRWWGW